MDDLVEFVRHRLDEDELLAKELTVLAGDGSWRVSGGGLASGDYELLAAYRALGQLSSWHLVHIARHDPARVLREVEAKRQILDLPSHTCVTVARRLALVWSDHPDYRPEWAA